MGGTLRRSQNYSFTTSSSPSPFADTIGKLPCRIHRNRPQVRLRQDKPTMALHPVDSLDLHAHFQASLLFAAQLPYEEAPVVERSSHQAHLWSPHDHPMLLLLLAHLVRPQWVPEPACNSVPSCPSVAKRPNHLHHPRPTRSNLRTLLHRLHTQAFVVVEVAAEAGHVRHANQYR